jgi:hypothetical protein
MNPTASIFALLLLSLAIGSCSSISGSSFHASDLAFDSTEYPMRESNYGYSEKLLTPGVWLVKVRVHAGTTEDDARSQIEKRAGQLCGAAMNVKFEKDPHLDLIFGDGSRVVSGRRQRTSSVYLATEYRASVECQSQSKGTARNTSRKMLSNSSNPTTAVGPTIRNAVGRHRVNSLDNSAIDFGNF